MEKQTNQKNEKRVVLNLSTSQAKELNHFLYLDGEAKGSNFEHYNLAVKLGRRISKTLVKQAGEALEEAMPALTQAIQGAIDTAEKQASGETCPQCRTLYDEKGDCECEPCDKCGKPAGEVEYNTIEGVYGDYCEECMEKEIKRRHESDGNN